MQCKIGKRTGTATVGVLCALTSACAVPIRYSVPAREFYGREVIGQKVDLLADGEAESRGIVAVESLDSERFGSDDPAANAKLRAALPKLKGEDVWVEVDDTRVWPSIVGALIFGQVGMFAGEGYWLATQTRSPDSTRDLIIAVSAGTIGGAAIGAFLGSVFASRVKSRHLAPLPPPKADPILLAPSPAAGELLDKPQ